MHIWIVDLRDEVFGPSVRTLDILALWACIDLQEHGTTAADSPLFAASESQLLGFGPRADVVWQRRAGPEGPYSWHHRGISRR